MPTVDTRKTIILFIYIILFPFVIENKIVIMIKYHFQKVFYTWLKQAKLLCLKAVRFTFNGV